MVQESDFQDLVQRSKDKARSAAGEGKMTFSDKNVKPQNILTITRGLIQRANELVEEYVFELIEENRDLRKQLTSALSDLEHEEKRAHELDVEAQELIEQNRKLQKKIDAHER